MLRALMNSAMAVAIAAAVAGGAVAADDDDDGYRQQEQFPLSWRCGGPIAGYWLKIDEDGDYMVAKRFLGSQKIVLSYADENEVAVFYGSFPCDGSVPCAEIGWDNDGEPFVLLAPNRRQVLKCRQK